MTKVELIKDLALKSFVEAVTEGNVTSEQVVGKETRRIYEVVYREVNGKVCRDLKAHLLVINEGMDSEKAYYLDKEPAATIV